MIYEDKIANEMLLDSRWTGIISRKLTNVWKSRGVIPDQYFNPHYLNLLAEGKTDLADKIKDKYYNEEYLIRVIPTEEEEKRERIILAILKSPKLITKNVLESQNIKYSYFNDAIRKTRSVPMFPQQTLMVKKEIITLRSKLQIIIEKIERVKTYELRHLNEIDVFLADKRIATLPYLLNNAAYANRHSTRKRNKSIFFDMDEVIYFIHCSKIFLFETQINL